MCIVMQYRHNDYVEKVMTIYSYDDPYIVINICHKHDAKYIMMILITDIQFSSLY
jgi:hypothetical protein